MNKKEFVDRLRWFACNDGAGLVDEYGNLDYRSMRGEAMLAGLLARWIDQSSVPDDSDEMDNFCHRLPDIIVEAYAELSSDARWSGERAAYRLATGGDIPNLVDAHAGGIGRVLVAHGVCRLIPLLTGEEWLRGRLESTMGAQMQVIDHAWLRFVRVAYRKLMPRINQESHRRNVGQFGSTTLSTFALAGRVEFRFSRGSGVMTYLADDGDAYGWRSGANSPGAPYAECVSMIEEVIGNWDIDRLLASYP